MMELGCVLENLSRVVPDGIVVFFPSYSYEEAVYNAWQKDRPGGQKSVLNSLKVGSLDLQELIRGWKKQKDDKRFFIKFLIFNLISDEKVYLQGTKAWQPGGRDPERICGDDRGLQGCVCVCVYVCVCFLVGVE